jgi:two-component system sensor histidine kinase PilS (NtrC family)
LRPRVARIIAARLIVSTLLLGSAMAVVLIQADSFPVNPFAFLIGVTYALSLLYLWTLRYVERHPVLVDAQFAADAVLITAFIHLTGGITSNFSTLYVLPVIAASTVRWRGGALQVAGLSATLYIGIVAAQYLDIEVMPSWLVSGAASLPTPGFAQYTVAINLGGMLAVALLAGSLAERLRSARAGLKDASHEIADLRAFNEHVIDSLVSGLVTADAAGRVLTFNRAASLITGLSPSTVIGRDVREVLQLSEDLDASMTSGETRRRVEIPFRAAGPRAIDIGLTMAPLRFPEGTAGFLFTFQDITELKRLERDARLQQRLGAVGEMAAGIAHEIRNPLAAMSGSMQVLREELPLSDEQAQLMDIVLRESDRLNERIRVFLAYARPERLAFSRVDVRRLLHDAVVVLRSSVDSADAHAIEVDVPATPVWCQGDEAEIRQILWHLGTNGLRSMPEGGTLRLAVHQQEGGDNGARVVLTVKDEGIGIPADQLDGIFQPFRGSFAKGAGLGLAIVHRIVSDYSGKVDVFSQPGVGTTVRVELPASMAAADATAGSEAGPQRRTA